MADDDFCDTPAHEAVEMEDLPTLRELLRSGVDPNEEQHGLTLLHHAIDVEIQGHVQTGQLLHANATALMLSAGAEPRDVRAGVLEPQHNILRSFLVIGLLRNLSRHG